MKFRNMFIILIVSLLLSSTALAQPRTGERGGRDEAQVKRMKEKIGLTDDQTAKVKEIMKKGREEARAEFDGADMDRDARREAMMKRMEKTDAEIVKLLNADQKKKYEEFKKERKKEMEERMKERR